MFDLDFRLIRGATLRERSQHHTDGLVLSVGTIAT